MPPVDKLTTLANDCNRIAQLIKQPPLSDTVDRLDKAIVRVAESSSNSWIGYQSRVYYHGFQRPAPGDYFSREWGFTSVFAQPVSDNWREVDFDAVYDFVMRAAGNPDTVALEKSAASARDVFEQNRDELLNTLTILLDQTSSSMLEELRGETRKLKLFNAAQIIDGLSPSSFKTRDDTAAEQGRMPPHHVRIFAWLVEQRLPFQNLESLSKIAGRATSFLERQQKMTGQSVSGGTECVFIGHGRDPQWKDVADFIQNRLKLPVEEFDQQAAAGMTTRERLQDMLNKATFAFLVMTAEDEHSNATMHARENVIHEIGLFQQKLGFRRAIILLEDGCSEFSNITGIVQIRFARGSINAKFDEIRQVLEREGVLRAG